MTRYYTYFKETGVKVQTIPANEIQICSLEGQDARTKMATNLRKANMDLEMENRTMRDKRSTLVNSVRELMNLINEHLQYGCKIHKDHLQLWETEMSNTSSTGVRPVIDDRHGFNHDNGCTSGNESLDTRQPSSHSQSEAQTTGSEIVTGLFSGLPLPANSTSSPKQRNKCGRTWFLNPRVLRRSVEVLGEDDRGSAKDQHGLSERSIVVLREILRLIGRKKTHKTNELTSPNGKQQHVSVNTSEHFTELELKKEKNRIAAQKCRERKEQSMKELKQRNAELEVENKTLHKQRKALQMKAEEYKRTIKCHCDVGCIIPVDLLELWNTEMTDEFDTEDSHDSDSCLEKNPSPPASTDRALSETMSPCLQSASQSWSEPDSDAPRALFSGTQLKITGRSNNSSSKSSSVVRLTRTISRNDHKPKELLQYLGSATLPKVLAPIPSSLFRKKEFQGEVTLNSLSNSLLKLSSNSCNGLQDVSGSNDSTDARDRNVYTAIPFSHTTKSHMQPQDSHEMSIELESSGSEMYAISVHPEGGQNLPSLEFAMGVVEGYSYSGVISSANEIDQQEIQTVNVQRNEKDNHCPSQTKIEPTVSIQASAAAEMSQTQQIKTIYSSPSYKAQDIPVSKATQDNQSMTQQNVIKPPEPNQPTRLAGQQQVLNARLLNFREIASVKKIQDNNGQTSNMSHIYATDSPAHTAGPTLGHQKFVNNSQLFQNTPTNALQKPNQIPHKKSCAGGIRFNQGQQTNTASLNGQTTQAFSTDGGRVTPNYQGQVMPMQLDPPYETLASLFTNINYTLPEVITLCTEAQMNTNAQDLDNTSPHTALYNNQQFAVIGYVDQNGSNDFLSINPAAQLLPQNTYFAQQHTDSEHRIEMSQMLSPAASSSSIVSAVQQSLSAGPEQYSYVSNNLEANP